MTIGALPILVNQPYKKFPDSTDLRSAFATIPSYSAIKTNDFALSWQFIAYWTPTLSAYTNDFNLNHSTSHSCLRFLYICLPRLLCLVLYCVSLLFHRLCPFCFSQDWVGRWWWGLPVGYQHPRRRTDPSHPRQGLATPKRSKPSQKRRYPPPQDPVFSIDEGETAHLRKEWDRCKHYDPPFRDQPILRQQNTSEDGQKIPKPRRRNKRKSESSWEKQRNKRETKQTQNGDR